MKNKLFYISFSLLLFFSCKKDKQPSPQYYGDPIIESKEHFPDQELFDFTTSPAVSPDGEYIAYVVSASMDSHQYGLWVINPKSQEKYLIKESAKSPDWKKNTYKLCYSLNGDIYTDNINGDSATRLTYDGGCYEPKWHPTKDTISYIQSTKGLHFITLSNKKITEIHEYNGGGLHNWNIDGKTILGFKSVAPYGYFTEWNVNNSSLTTLRPFEKHYNTNPIYSPNETKILFSNENGIFIMNRDGSNVQQLLYNKANRMPGKPYKKADVLFGDINWFPDGKHIIYQQIEFLSSSIRFGNVYGEGYSTLYKLDIEKALQINKP